MDASERDRERARERDRMYQNEDAIRNALERAAVVSRNGVFRNLVHTPCTTIGIEICSPIRSSSAIEIREMLDDRKWQGKLYSYAAIARCMLKRAIVLHFDRNMRALKIAIAFQGKLFGISSSSRGYFLTKSKY